MRKNRYSWFWSCNAKEGGSDVFWERWTYQDNSLFFLLLWQHQTRKERVVLAHSLKTQHIMVGEALEQAHDTSGHIISPEEAERHGCRCSEMLSLPYHFIYSVTQAYRLVPPTHRVALLSSIKPLWKHPRREIQKMGLLIQLIVKNSHLIVSVVLVPKPAHP